MTILLSLQSVFNHLQMQWNTWWDECFPSAIPLPEVKEIPERKVLFEQLEEHRKNHARDSAARYKGIQAITRDLNAAQQAVDQLQQQLTILHRAEWLSDLQASTEIERVQGMIIEKAPLSLCMFLEEIDSELSRLRQMQPTIVPNGSDRDYSLMKKTMQFKTNSASIKRRVVALQAARERAVGMQMENLTVKQIIDQIYLLRRELPDIQDEQTRGSLAAALLGH